MKETRNLNLKAYRPVSFAPKVCQLIGNEVGQVIGGGGYRVARTMFY